jgi:hypothetical protein
MVLGARLYRFGSIAERLDSCILVRMKARMPSATLQVSAAVARLAYPMLLPVAVAVMRDRSRDRMGRNAAVGDRSRLGSGVSNRYAGSRNRGPEAGCAEGGDHRVNVATDRIVD